MSHALITGATGFIGRQLVKRLSEQGSEITCLVRQNSDLQPLAPYAPRLVSGDALDAQAVREAVKSVDVVFHLAGQTKAVQSRELFRVNEAGTRTVAAACACSPTPPLLIYVSSIAAAGPSQRGCPKQEDDPATPVSQYGRSKLAGEVALQEFATSLPISIVRPPIVLGPGDRTGLALFQSIAQVGLHFVPGYAEADMSIIHVDDLVSALQAVANCGRRLASTQSTEGIYFVAADETPTYAMLGRWIGQALGRKRTLIVRVPGIAMRGAGLTNEVVGRFSGAARYLNWDKVREALAGSWQCSPQRLQKETNFSLPNSLQTRLQQTAEWYIARGWLKPPRLHASYPNSPMAEQ